MNPAPPLPIVLPNVVVPGNDLIVGSHQVREPVHSTWVNSYLDSNPNGDPQCETLSGHNNFVGTHDFSGIVYATFNTDIQGTDSAFSGHYETNIVHEDGVTTTLIKATWNFKRK
jgi:hypothetical protein